MCGIVGFVNTELVARQGRKKWFESALFIDQLRGQDSTGVILVPKKAHNTVIKNTDLRGYKRALAATDFLELSRTKEILRDADDCRAIIGHNRYATQGNKHDGGGAHPFSFGDISLVHNGTLSTRTGLKHNYVVDSAAIAAELAETATSEYTSVLSQLDGAFALVWINVATNRLYFTRNDERTLYCGLSKDGKTLFYASEDWMIKSLCERQKPSIDLQSVALVTTGYLYSVDYTADTIEIEEEAYTPSKSWDYYLPAKKGGGAGGNSTSGSRYPHTQQKSIGYIDTDSGTCPTKVGDIMYASDWSYMPGTGKGKGVITGVDYENPDIHFSVANVSQQCYKTLLKDSKEWEEVNEEDEGMEILLVGEVCYVGGSKTAKGHYVQLKVTSLKIEAYDDDDDCYDDIKEPVVSTIPNKTFKIGDKLGTWGEWIEAVSAGCSFCGQVIAVSTADNMAWTTTIINGEETVHKPICTDCKKERKLH